jgi:pimeloyl-ACP methyl ester carboxylesterase
MLAGGGRYVIRYDHRDTGRSVSYPPGKPDYSFYDLVEDAAALIDRFASGPADIAGLSMGGGIAQVLAVDHPDKVASLTLIATSPLFPADLPPLTPALLDAYAAMTEPDWDDDESALEHFVHGARIHSGPDVFDEDAARADARRLIARTTDLRTLGNHNAMKQADRPERDFRALVEAITVPTLVVHGTADPMLTQEHGIALAEAIPGAALLLLDGVGHQSPPPSTWGRVIAAMPYSPNTRRV